MASSTPSTIVLRSNNPNNSMQRPMEAICQAGGTIRPGMLLAQGTGNSVKAHATAGGNREANKVALENPWHDGGGVAIDEIYNVGETVFYVHAVPGDVLYMLLKTGSNVAKGAALESGGAGALQAAAGTAIDSLVGYADEAVNNASGSDARIRVRMA